MSDLQTHRDNIDQIDREIVRLIAKRKQEVEGVIECKKKTGLPALQKARFDEVVKKVRKLAEDESIDPDLVEDIWHRLHDYFLVIEEKSL